MLRIEIPETEYFDERTNEFVTIRKQTIQLEHSLVSISKWESKWRKAFLGREEKTSEEIVDYIKCMTVTPNVDPACYYALTDKDYKTINEYIESPMTATWFHDEKSGPPSRETVTSELIYYWMIALNIPFECQKWHLNRLLTLIRVCNVKNAPAKKMSKADLMKRNRALNAARRNSMHTHG